MGTSDGDKENLRKRQALGHGAETPVSKLPPRGKVPAISVVIDCSGTTSDVLRALICDLLDSTYSDFRVYFRGLSPKTVELDSWLAEDPRFVLHGNWNGFDDGSRFTLYLPPDSRLIRYALEAMVEAVFGDQVSVLRVLGPGRGSGVEFWKSDSVRRAGSITKAEDLARRNRAERWVNADSLGIWTDGMPYPKPFIRRGAAAEHVLEVQIHDSRGDVTMDRHATESAILKREVRRLRMELEILSGTVQRVNHVRVLASKIRSSAGRLLKRS